MSTHLDAAVGGGGTLTRHPAGLTATPSITLWSRHAKDVPALVALLREDAYMAMPPTPSWYQGRDHIGIYLRQLFVSSWGRDLRLVPTGANRQPALAVYAPASDGNGYQPFAIKVLTVHNGLVVAVTGFVHPGLFGRFGLPPQLPAAACR